MGQDSDRERRRNQRVEIDVIATLPGTLAAYLPIRVRIRDLSVSGIGFESDRKFARGEIFELELPVPPTPITIQACIAWASSSGGPYKYGAFVRELDPVLRKRLLRWVLLQMEGQGLEPLSGDGPAE